MTKRLSLALLPLITACAGAFPGAVDLVRPGETEMAVVTSLGAPAERKSLPNGGYQLDYPRQPLGYENWRVILNADNRVVRVEQLIDEDHFAQLKTGMSEAEVRQLLGRPSEEQAYKAMNEYVLSWRYREFGNRLMWFNAHFDGQWKYKASSRTPDWAQQSVDSGS